MLRRARLSIAKRARLVYLRAAHRITRPLSTASSPPPRPRRRGKVRHHRSPAATPLRTDRMAAGIEAAPRRRDSRPARNRPPAPRALRWRRSRGAIGAVTGEDTPSLALFSPLPFSRRNGRNWRNCWGLRRNAGVAGYACYARYAVFGDGFPSHRATKARGKISPHSRPRRRSPLR